MPAFDLRCRESEWIDRPETVKEFGRAVALPAEARHADIGEALIADSIARAHHEIESVAEGRTIVSCQMPRYGIPLGVRDLDRSPTEAWNIREGITGDWIDMGADGRPSRSLSMQVRRGLIAVAGVLPLLVSPTLVHAADPPTIELQNFEQLAPPPSLPEDRQAEPAPSEAPTAAPTASPPTAAPPTPAPTVAPPAPRIGGASLSMTGNSLWDGLSGKLVRLELKDATVLAGTVVAQSAGEIALARASDGMVVSVPKAELAAVRVRPATTRSAGGSSIPVGERPRQDGRGLLAGGVMLVSLGSILALTGTVFLAISPSYVGISLPMLLPGLGLAGAGAGMLVASSKKRKAFNKAWGVPRANLQITPTLRAGRQGGQAGLVLRF